MWGDTTTTPGGKALPFYSSVRVQLARINYVKNSAGQQIASTVKATVKKNKVAPPLKTAEFQIEFIEKKSGNYPRINTELAILDWLEANKLIEGKGGRVVIHDKSLYKKDWVAEMRSNPELLEELTKLAYSVQLPADNDDDEEIVDTSTNDENGYDDKADEDEYADD